MPAIQPDSLIHIPLRLRPLVRDALNGSAKALAAVSNRILRGDPHLSTHLPIIHALLDPARMPPLVELDDDRPNPASASAMNHGIAVLQALARLWIDNLNDITPSLWARTWSWLQQVDIYRYCVSDPKVAECSHFMSILLITGFYGHPATTDIVDATLGVRLVLARAWATAVAQKDFYVLKPLELFIGSSHINLAHINELIEGAGGTARHLCALVVKHIELLTSHPDHYSDARLEHLSFLGVKFCTIHQRLTPVLLGCGVVRALVSLLLVLSTDTRTHARGIGIAFSMLEWTVSTSPGYKWIRQALKAGLLRVILVCTENNTQLDYINRFLRKYIPNSLAYYSVLTQLESSLLDIIDGAIPETSGVSEAWSGFLQLGHRFRRLKEQYDRGEYSSMYACDNMECAIILEKSLFKRCNSCQNRYYCSPACQKRDWRRIGGHRDECDKLRCSRLEYIREGPEMTSRRDRSFLRVLVDHEFKRIQPTLLLEKATWMLEHPGEFCCTVFNFTLPPTPRGKIARVRNWTLKETEHVPRVLNGRGRIDLHVAVVWEGRYTRHKLMPLRSSGPEIDDGLRRIVEGIKSHKFSSSELPEKIKILMKETEGVVQIHCDCEDEYENYYTSLA